MHVPSRLGCGFSLPRAFAPWGLPGGSQADLWASIRGPGVWELQERDEALAPLLTSAPPKPPCGQDGVGVPLVCCHALGTGSVPVISQKVGLVPPPGTVCSRPAVGVPGGPLALVGRAWVWARLGEVAPGSAQQWSTRPQRPLPPAFQRAWHPVCAVMGLEAWLTPSPPTRRLGLGHGLTQLGSRQH